MPPKSAARVQIFDTATTAQPTPATLTRSAAISARAKNLREVVPDGETTNRPLVIARSSQTPVIPGTSGSDFAAGGLHALVFPANDVPNNAHTIGVATITGPPVSLQVFAQTKHKPAGGCRIAVTSPPPGQPTAPATTAIGAHPKRPVGKGTPMNYHEAGDRILVRPTTVFDRCEASHKLVRASPSSSPDSDRQFRQ